MTPSFSYYDDRYGVCLLTTYKEQKLKHLDYIASHLDVKEVVLTMTLVGSKLEVKFIIPRQVLKEQIHEYCHNKTKVLQEYLDKMIEEEKKK